MGCISGLVRTMGKSFLMAMSLALLLDAQLWAATVNVTVQAADATGTLAPITTGFRWLLEEDVTYANIPGSPSPYGPRDPNSLSYNFHKSYMPVAAKGDNGVGGGGTAVIQNVDPTKRYFLSVLPHRPANSDCQDPGQPKCYSLSGTQVAFSAAGGPANVTVVVATQPIPSAQISVYAFHDNNPINHAPDVPQEGGLGGFSVIISDQGGQLLTDVYGNPLGTTYSGLDGAGQPILQTPGSGIILTMTQAEVNNPATNPHGLRVGEALIKHIAPGKYAVRMVPPTGQGWQQVTTIEGTQAIDAWVRAGEPRYLVEFGPSLVHVFMGFVQQFDTIPAAGEGQATGTIIGEAVNGHLDRLAHRVAGLNINDGHLVPNCWVGLNTTQLGGATRGIYAAPCKEDSSFEIKKVPPGNYQLVVWDTFLDHIIRFQGVNVPETGGVVNMGKQRLLAWFARQDHFVFNDINENGQRDPGEPGIPEQAVNLRNRDGTIYQSFPTDAEGYVPFDEVFPFFHWQVAEVDFLRFKATGVTVYVDGGGPVNTATQEAPGWGKLNPQLQPDNNGLPSRTETGLILLEAYQGYQGTTNVFEWGKANYAFGENGGISGIVHYAVTRAENDPQLAVGDPWEPGIPRVQVNLYERAVNSPGVIRDVNGVPGIQKM
jgi:large repetitive protein